MRFLCIIIVLYCFQLSLHAVPSPEPVQPPNIIFILTDDQRWDALGYAGNGIIHTPVMDELAREGLYFRNAFVTTPICAASRASIMTGLYERSHGFTFGTLPLKAELANQTYPALLKEHGYATGFIGKFGMKFENRIDTAIFDFYSRPGEQSGATTYYRLNEDHTGFRHLSQLIGDMSLDFIKKYNNEGPFCLSVSFHAPHAEDGDPRQYIYPLDMDSLYRGITIPPPMFGNPGDFSAQPQWVREGLNRVRWRWRFDTESRYQEMVKGYYRMISGVDREIGRIRDQLEGLGIAGNTIIILMGDNGYFLGERGFAGKWLMYEHSLRVPLIIYDPVNGYCGNLDEMALNIDIAPTILRYAGIEVPGNMQGRDLSELQMDTPVEWRSAFLCEHLYDHPKIARSEGIRTSDYKYFRYIDHPGHEELYNLAADPWEEHNLAGLPGYGGLLNDLRQQCETLINHGKEWSAPDPLLRFDFDTDLDQPHVKRILGLKNLELSEGNGKGGSNAVEASYVGYEQGSERIVVRFDLPGSYREATLNYAVKFREGFRFVISGKLHGLGPVRPITGGNPMQPRGWSARITFSGDGIKTYVYHQGKQGKWGESQSAADFHFIPGQYHDLAIYVKVNDPVEASNGRVEIYADGRLIVVHDSLQLRSAGGPDTEISKFLFETFHGGNTPDFAPRDNQGNYSVETAWFDDIEIYSGRYVRSR